MSRRAGCAARLQVLHIHCRHGDGNFSKFEFFQHQYTDANISGLDIKVVKNYATYLAVSTWRALQGAPSQAKPPSPPVHSEL